MVNEQSKTTLVAPTDDENRAVRAFLMLYDTAPHQRTVGNVMNNMRLCGFPLWPQWVEKEHPNNHLTKAGAQSWIRYLLSLENDRTLDEND